MGLIATSAHAAHKGDAADLTVRQPAAKTSIPVKDFATRVSLIGQFVSHLETVDPGQLAQLVAAGLSPEALERLRNLTLSEAARFASGHMGLSIHIDFHQLAVDLGRVDRTKSDREQYESFVRRGASVRLVAKLFSLAEAEVRRDRKQSRAASLTVGRPRLPDDDTRDDVKQAWQAMVSNPLLGERERWWSLACRFPDLSIISLEAIVGSV